MSENEDTSPLGGPPNLEPDGQRARLRDRLFGSGRSDIAPGVLVAGRYRVLAELGRGASAVVYHARDELERGDVAIKFLHTPTALRGTARERMLLEAQVVARLRHPNIVAILDAGSIDEATDYLVLERLGGCSLAGLLGEPRDWPEAAPVLLSLGEGLAHAHAHGVIHRDLNPHNVFVDQGHCRILDFGLAKIVVAPGETVESSNLTSTGVIFGTPRYMSPEQAVAGKVDGRSDLYAFGCIAYELLAGRPAFDGPTVSAVLLQHLKADPPPLRRAAPRVPGRVCDAIHRALRKSPEDRWPSVAAFVQALRREVP